jgi:hypothetical protein
MSDAPQQTPAQHRKFGLLVLGMGVGLALVILVLVLLNHQYWMFAFLLLIIPNIYIGVRELRASRTP